jgi:hypothetical protein
LKNIPEEHRLPVSEFLTQVSSALSNNADPKRVFHTKSAMTTRGFFGETKQKNLSGIVYGEYQGVAYVPFFFTIKKKQGLGSRVLLQLEKMFFDRKSNPITGMVVFATRELQAYYLKRGFASLDKPRLTGHSVNGKRLRLKIGNSGLLDLFPPEEVVILYKMCSEMLFTTFISSFDLKFDSKDLKVTDMNCLQDDINKLDSRYKP